MSYSQQEIQEIVRRVADEVSGIKAGEQKSELSIFCGDVYDPQRVRRYFSDKLTTCVLPDHVSPFLEGCRALTMVADRQKILEELKMYEEIVLVTPPLSLLSAIASLDDSTFLASLVIRPLLWGKTIKVLLDFGISASMRNTAMGRIADNLDGLERMGVTFLVLGQSNPKEDEVDLVSEQEVRAAIREGRRTIYISTNAIVTQLASDVAKAHGISIERG